MSVTNGHVAEADDDRSISSPQPLRSESELSDLNDLPTLAAPSTTAHHETESEDDALHDMATSELDEDEDAPGEEDADFDGESPATHEINGMRHDRSSSEESTRPEKRKAHDVDDEEYMKQNPELYGLRRSVRGPSGLLSHYLSY